MSFKDYEILEKLGDGAYSIVYKVKRLSDKIIYALKKVRISKLKDKEKRNALNEIRILASINHPNIIAYKEAFFDETTQSLCLVMEYADGGDLLEKIRLYQKKGCYMSESFIWSMLIQLIRGLKCLHDLDIIHRDIKSANVFLTGNGGVKMGDMNVSKIAKDCLLHTQTGTPYYASPEVWKDLPYDKKSDLWSLGCVLYEAVCLKPPFRADDMQNLFKKVSKGDYVPIPKTFSSDLSYVIDNLIQTNPENRLRCSDVLSLPFINRHIKINEEAGLENELLKTITFPEVTDNFPANLPRPNFEDSPKRNMSNMLPKIKSINKQSIFREKSEPESSHAMHSSNERGSEKSMQYLKKYRRMVLIENYGALKVPKLRYYGNDQREGRFERKRSVSRVKSEIKPRKNGINKSLMLKLEKKTDEKKTDFVVK